MKKVSKEKDLSVVNKQVSKKEMQELNDFIVEYKTTQKVKSSAKKQSDLQKK
jgi:hypothetical protein